jgi:hypothetical protein
VENF